jgi:2-polyprenyl-3-methyl-5-hydroxy-6-metoxy-1,4-benzoquinol methylase
MEGAPAPTPWSRLAICWEDLFPLRQPRLDLALGLCGPGQRCLDAGCATGSLPRALAARGRVAHGLDLDPAFLAEARRRATREGLTVTWHEASLLDLAAVAGGARFRLVTCLGQTLPHLLEEAQWLAFFHQVRQVLEPGGCLVLQAVHDGGLAAGQSRDLPPVRCPAGTLERRRTLLSRDLAQFDTVFCPAGGEPVAGRSLHLRVAPARAAELMREAGLRPGPALADEAGQPFQETTPGWVLIARPEPDRRRETGPGRPS